jgi:carbamoyl-phosphate synthase small subunit
MVNIECPETSTLSALKASNPSKSDSEIFIPGKLVLETGESFIGKMPDWQHDIYFGEVVFTTGMSGYIESLTDPSFAGQLLTFTYPLIGNYGVPKATLFEELLESDQIAARGVILSQAIEKYDHFQAGSGLIPWLKQQKVPLLCEIDTRALTKILRHKGTVKAAILRTDQPIPTYFPDPNQDHLVKSVSRKSLTHDLYASRAYPTKAHTKTIIVVDCGIKKNILRHLQRFPFDLKIVPFDYDFSQENFDGVFLSNGPGDPEQCVETIRNLKKILPLKKPIFGICLGAQILALAMGAKTYKLPFGHRGQNQPCLELSSQKAYLTSQNHGYAIDEHTLPPDWTVTFRHLNDQTVAGISHRTLPYSAVQFHPEAAPGPQDTHDLFKVFYEKFD